MARTAQHRSRPRAVCTAGPSHALRARRGFTLIELALASVLGALVVLAAAGMLYAANRTEQAFSGVAQGTRELEITRSTIQRAWDNMVTLRGQPPEEDEDRPIGLRPRMILEPDGAADPGVARLDTEGPQRLEMALAQAPISMGLATQAATSAFADDDAGSRDFISADGSGGSMRGVFEWRQDGERERVLTELGLRSVLADKVLERADGRRGWTLWFRRLPAWEVERLELGMPHMADREGTPEERVQRLAGSVRLLTQVADGKWSIILGGTDPEVPPRVEAFECTYTAEVPIFIEFEAELLTGRGVSWMFEVAWTEGADPVPLDIGDDDVDNAEDDDPAGDGGTPNSAPGASPGRGSPTTGAGMREGET